MKILHLYKTYLPNTIGGVEQSINQLAISTQSKGVVNTILTMAPNQVDRTITVNGHLVHRCRSIFELASTPISLSAFLRFRQLANDADLIHYHFPYPFADILHFSLNTKKPTVVTYHSDIIKQKNLLRLYRPLKNFFLKSVSHIVATSPNYVASSTALSTLKNKLSVIPIGLDPNTYPCPKANKLEYWKNRFGLRFFLFIGVLRYYKGLDILIDAAINSTYPIVIVGAGPIQKKLEKKAASLGVQNIHFLGYLPEEDKVALLTLCFAVVFPSYLRSEAFGISLLEGAMHGKPLISSEIGTGTSYINIDGETGIVVPPGDAVSLRSAMDYLWNTNAEANKMGFRAKQRYKKLFTAEIMADSYISLYKTLIAK